MQYTQKAIAGFSWHSLFRLTSLAISAGKLIVMARLLDPRAFGLFSLATIAIGLTEAFTETGINITIVQSSRKSSYFIDTAWVIAIVRGLIIGGIMVMLGWGMQSFYQEPALMGLVALAALVPVIKGLINPSIVDLIKKFHFGADALLRTSQVAVDAVVTVSLGYFFQSAWVFLAGMIAAALFEVAVSFIFLDQRPRFRLNSKVFTEIMANMKWLQGASALNYLLENGDNLLVGKFLGTTNLGLYHNGYASAHKVTYQFGQSVTHSIFPIFSKMKDTARVLSAFTRTVLVASLGLLVLITPVLIWPELIILLLGDKWAPILPSLRWFLIGGWLQAIATIFYGWYLAQEKYRWLTTHQIVALVLMVILLWWWTPQYQLVGAAMAIMVSRLVASPLLLASYLYARART